MSGEPWMKWYWQAWFSETRLKMVTRAARSLWLDMLGLMHESPEYGYLIVAGVAPTAKELATILGDRPHDVAKWLTELERVQIFSRDGRGTIFSRRMLRDKAKRELDHGNGPRGGNPNIRPGTVPKDERQRRFRRSDNPAKTRRIFEKDKGACHWCGVALIFKWDGQGDQPPPNLFHVDHVLPIKDGGGNDEDNLVAACAVCNHDRKNDADHNIVVRVGSESDHNQENKSDPNSDPNAKNLEARREKLDLETRKEEKTKEEEAPQQVAARYSRGKATRWEGVVPDDWITEGEQRRAKHNLEPINLRVEAECFANYWSSKSGKDATKLDWHATWMNRAVKAEGGRRGAGKAPPPVIVPSEKAERERRLWLREYAVDGRWTPNTSKNGVWRDPDGVGAPPHDERTLVTDEDLVQFPKAVAMRERMRKVVSGSEPPML